MHFKNLIIFPISLVLGAGLGWLAGALGHPSGEIGMIGIYVFIGMVVGLCFGSVIWLYFRKQQSVELRRGIVKWFNPNKGFGFIEQDKGEDLFVHRTEIRNNKFRSLNKDDQVEFEVGRGKKGPVAKNVRKVPAHKRIIRQYARAR